MKFNRFSSLIIAFVITFTGSALAITEREVIAQPRNIDLNRTFAIEQLAANNLHISLAASERVIRIAPADLNARLLRSQILIKMGRGKEALGDLKTMSKLPLPTAQLRRINAMLKQLDSSLSSLKINARIRFSYKNTDNANNYPEGGQFEAITFGNAVRTFDYTDTINNQTEKLEDNIFSTTVGVNGQYKYSDDIRDYIHFSATYTLNEGEETVQSDSNLVAASVGLHITRGLNDFNIGIGKTIINQVNSTQSITNNEPINVNSDVDLTSVTGTYARRLPQGIRLFYNLSYSELDHSKTTNANLYDSTKFTHIIGVTIPVINSVFLRASYNYGERRAEEDTNVAISRTSRDTDGYGGTIYWRPMQNHLISVFFNYSESDYLEQVSSNPRKRSDETNTYGVNYSFQGDVIHELFEDWKVTASFAARETDSNLIIYNVESQTIGLTVERKFNIL